MRVLYIDDSGKPEQSHQSKAVVLAGLAIDAEVYPQFARRVNGAKARYYPGRGVPQKWEIKSTDIIKPNPWNRRKNRRFAFEIARIANGIGATAYACTIVKANMNHPMTLATSMPLQMQALVEHFDAECQVLGRMGMVVADWSSHQQDQHMSRCVASFVASRKLCLHPGVYYASSHANEAIQAADLIAGVHRRVEEGDQNLVQLDQSFASILAGETVGKTTKGRAFSNQIALI